jgi:hypothetical protein
MYRVVRQVSFFTGVLDMGFFFLDILYIVGKISLYGVFNVQILGLRHGAYRSWPFFMMIVIIREIKSNKALFGGGSQKDD